MFFSFCLCLISFSPSLLSLLFASLLCCSVCQVCACTFVCECMQSACVPRHGYAGERSTSIVSPCFPPIEHRVSSSSFSLACSRLAHPSSLPPTAHLIMGTQTLQTHTRAPGFCVCSGNFNSRPEVCTSNVLLAGASLQLSFLLCSPFPLVSSPYYLVFFSSSYFVLNFHTNFCVPCRRGE